MKEESRHGKGDGRAPIAGTARPKRNRYTRARLSTLGGTRTHDLPATGAGCSNRTEIRGLMDYFLAFLAAVFARR